MKSTIHIIMELLDEIVQPGPTERDGTLTALIPNHLLEDWSISRSTKSSFMVLLKGCIEDII